MIIIGVLKYDKVTVSSLFDPYSLLEKNYLTTFNIFLPLLL